MSDVCFSGLLKNGEHVQGNKLPFWFLNKLVNIDQFTISYIIKQHIFGCVCQSEMPWCEIQNTHFLSAEIFVSFCKLWNFRDAGAFLWNADCRLWSLWQRCLLHENRRRLFLQSWRLLSLVRKFRRIRWTRVTWH